MIKQTLEEWTEEGKRLFGDYVNWKFVCPACGRISTGQEFKDLGCDPNEMYQCCIGRHNGNMRPSKKAEDGNGCDWCAFGLLRTLGKGRIVIAPDGKEIEVFDFAPVPVPQEITIEIEVPEHAEE